MIHLLGFAHRFAVVLLLPLFAHRGEAQSTATAEPASIPVGLVTALLASGAPDAWRDARYSIDALPLGWPPDLVPPAPATVVGGLTSGPHRVVVFAFPGSNTDGREMLHRLMARAEWTDMNRERPGKPGPPFSIYCKGSEQAILSLQEGPATSTAKLWITGRSEMNMCSLRNASTNDWSTRLDLPTLEPPSGMRYAGGSSGGGPTYVHASTQLTGDVHSPSSLLKHYNTLLKTAGWTLSAPVADERGAVQSVSARDRDGILWEGSVVVATSPERSTMSFQMFRREQGK